jgi:nucleotide-binding universal stress UspA family protein
MATVISTPAPPETTSLARRILVCLDRSRFSEVCVPYAVSLAKAFGSTITLVHVMQHHQAPERQPSGDALGWELSRQEARAYLERLEKEVSQALGQPVEVKLEQGHPAERIVDLAQQLGAGLTLIGSHGESGITPWSLGSTVQQILSVTRGSVLIVHSSSQPPAEVSFKRVLVPLDGSLRAESVVPAAARLASIAGGELLLVHVVHEPLPTSSLYSPADLELARTLAAHLEASAGRYLQRAQEQLAHAVTAVRTRVVRHSNERQCLLDLSLHERPDLIILAAHGSACDPSRSFGSVATYLLSHSRVPLLVLQDLPESGAEQGEPVEGGFTPRFMRASYAPENA